MPWFGGRMKHSALNFREHPINPNGSSLERPSTNPVSLSSSLGTRPNFRLQTRYHKAGSQVHKFSETIVNCLDIFLSSM